MFNPTRDEVRETFFATWRKYRGGEPLAGIETLALEVILAHPEYHEILSHPDRFRERDYVDESNPFLHMSLHLALEEQLSIDQPPGIRRAWQKYRAGQPLAGIESLALDVILLHPEYHGVLSLPGKFREKD